MNPTLPNESCCPLCGEDYPHPRVIHGITRCAKCGLDPASWLRVDQLLRRERDEARTELERLKSQIQEVEVAQAKLTLEDAQRTRCCRICGKPMGEHLPFILNYGKEFAHEICLIGVAEKTTDTRKCPRCGGEKNSPKDRCELPFRYWDEWELMQRERDKALAEIERLKILVDDLARHYVVTEYRWDSNKTRYRWWAYRAGNMECAAESALTAIEAVEMLMAAEKAAGVLEIAE